MCTREIVSWKCRYTPREQAPWCEIPIFVKTFGPFYLHTNQAKWLELTGQVLGNHPLKLCLSPVRATSPCDQTKKLHHKKLDCPCCTNSVSTNADLSLSTTTTGETHEKMYQRYGTVRCDLGLDWSKTK